MGSISSEDAFDLQSEISGSYSQSADVSESESCCSISISRYDADADAASSSSLSSSLLHSSGFAVAGMVPARLMLPVVSGRDVVMWERRTDKREMELSEIQMMKERFAKLLLGEDMSGGGKGVCTALAISNAITNLSATVFGELWRLEPLSPQRKSMWRREMEWLLCVSDSIVELIPSLQEFPGGDGRKFEVMVARPRSDLYVNLPALKKLDAMLISILDGFKETEFSYMDRGSSLGDADLSTYPSSSSSSGRPSVRQEEKWWLPCPRVPAKGLSDDARKRLQQCRDCVNQILKAAMAINSSVLAEMEIPDVYLESLPKSGKSCLGEIMHRYITAEQFSPECLLDLLDLSSEHHTLEIANRIEAAIHVWSLKDLKKQSPRTKTRRRPWGGKVKALSGDAEKSHLLAQRAESLLQCLRLRYPGLPQTILDMNKIQYNKDVGQSILESYSRVMESLAFNILARIDDLIYVDDMTKCSVASESHTLFNRGGFDGLPKQKKISPSPFSIHNSPFASSFGSPSSSTSPVEDRVPTGDQSSPSKPSRRERSNGKLEKVAMSKDVESSWLYTRSLSARRTSGDAPERD